MNVESTLFHPAVLDKLRATPEIFATIRNHNGKELGLQKKLREAYDDHIVRAALIMIDLRQRAAGKFSRADRMWFDRTGLEQCTCEAIAKYKAQRFQSETIDICSGVGGDSIAMAANVNVVSIDRVEARGKCLAWNAEAYERSERIHVVTKEATVSDVGDRLVHIDPDRRAGPRGRSLRIDDLEPGPEFLNELMRTAKGGAIKLSPASNFRGSFDEHEVELISWRGECKEATVWFGELQSDSATRATIVETGETIAGDLSLDMAELSEPMKYVFDPDPALVRSGLMDQLAIQHRMYRLDDDEEYLTADVLPETSFLPGTFELLANLPNDGKALRRYTRENSIGRIEIKARRLPIDVEKVRRSLKLKGKEPAVALFARVAGQARVLVARRIKQRPTASGCVG